MGGRDLKPLTLISYKITNYSKKLTVTKAYRKIELVLLMNKGLVFSCKCSWVQGVAQGHSGANKMWVFGV